MAQRSVEEEVIPSSGEDRKDQKEEAAQTSPAAWEMLCLGQWRTQRPLLEAVRKRAGGRCQLEKGCDGGGRGKEREKGRGEGRTGERGKGER